MCPHRYCRGAGKLTGAGVETRPAGFVGDAVTEGIARIHIRTNGDKAIGATLVHAGGWGAGYGGGVVDIGDR